MNGLNGRMLKMPAPKNKSREILLIYGMHASIERLFGLTKVLNKYGAVTLPDLPGFGGMEPFYKIGEKPSIDNLADYLAAFVKMRYKRKKITIMAMSLGFSIATRMLQKFPEIAKNVELLVSVVGFVHHEEFVFSKSNFLMLQYGARVGSQRLPALFIKKMLLRSRIIRMTYLSVADKHVKMKDADVQERDERIAFEIKLWQINDIRTYMHTAKEMLSVNLCKQQVAIPVNHIAVSEDRYFDNHIVEQHLGVIYTKVTVIPAKMKQHAPTVIADIAEASQLIPPKLRTILNTPSQNTKTLNQKGSPSRKFAKKR